MFPDPMKVFQNLMRLWNNFSNEKKFTLEDQEEYARWLHKNAGVSKYKLETTIVHMREKKATGFTGWIVYELNADDEWNKTTQTLARFAEYSNIGGNRTGGFGVTKMKRTTKRLNEHSLGNLADNPTSPYKQPNRGRTNPLPT